MKDKILVWVDGDMFNFGMAKYIQDNYDCELFSIVDISGKARAYFQNQDVVKFKKTWFYDEIISQRKADLEYLVNFEKKYKVNLWEIAYTDRYFYKKWNKYYQYDIDEILVLLERICRLCEEVLEEVKPDYFLIKAPGAYHHNLIYRVCKENGIKTLILVPDRFGYRSLILSDPSKFDSLKISEVNKVKRTKSELEEYLEQYSTSKQQKEGVDNFEVLKISQMLRWFYKFFLSKDPYTINISSYGQTRWKVLVEGLSLSIKKIYRERFMEKNFKTRIESDTPFVYFPLHYEPEMILLTYTPFYTDQIQVITNLAKSLPMGYKLYVKEHPAMKLVGWRKISYYKQIMELPNVELIHPSISSKEMIEKCSMVACVAGSTGLEAAFHGKCSILFSNVMYDILSCIHKVDIIENLPKIVRECLNDQVNIDDLNEYVNLVEENSFKFDIFNIYNKVYKTFYENGLVSNVTIEKETMEDFLQENKIELEILAKEHIKKIKLHKDAIM